MKMFTGIKLSEAEELMVSQEGESGTFSIPTSCGEGTVIILDNDFIRIPSLGIDIHDGVFCNLVNDAGEDCWEADYSLYVFYKLGDHTEPVYDEGGSSLEVCIANYSKLPMNKVGKLSCEVYII